MDYFNSTHFESRRTNSSQASVLKEKVNILNNSGSISELNGGKDVSENIQMNSISSEKSANVRKPFQLSNVLTTMNAPATRRSRVSTDQNKFSTTTFCTLNDSVDHVEPETPCPFNRSGLTAKKRLHHLLSEEHSLGKSAEVSTVDEVVNSSSQNINDRSRSIKSS